MGFAGCAGLAFWAPYAIFYGFAAVGGYPGMLIGGSVSPILAIPTYFAFGLLATAVLLAAGLLVGCYVGYIVEWSLGKVASNWLRVPIALAYLLLFGIFVHTYVANWHAAFPRGLW